MQRLAIVGAGKGGVALIEVLNDNTDAEIIGVCDKDPIAPGILEANRLGIKTFLDAEEMVGEIEKIDLVINVTGVDELGVVLARVKKQGTEIINGRSALLIWQLTQSQRRLMRQAQQRLNELQDLYELGLKLSSSVDLREVYAAILDYATMLIQAPAGSIALLDEGNGEMNLAAAKGFSSDFFKLSRWKLRKGGLTSRILNQESPLILSEVDSLVGPVNPVLIEEGIKSLIATPLKVRGKIVGVLYVDDFVKRDFTGKDVSILTLLSGYAALAIERMKLLDDTRRMAITDGLTGLRNQQEFMTRLEEEVDRARRYRRPLSIVGLDVDYFKLYNDNYGHVAGNELLRLLARIMRDNSRVTDVCARTGGEEFAIIMPETVFTEALRLSERLREAVEETTTVPDGSSIAAGVTISVGVASYPEHGQSSTEIYKAVDKALYRAKESGRNMVVGFSEPWQPRSDRDLDPIGL